MAKSNTTQSDAEQTFQREATENALPVAEQFAPIIGVDQARSKLETDGLAEAKRLGVEAKHARKIIDTTLQAFDAFIAQQPGSPDESEDEDEDKEMEELLGHLN
jgi:hypothetical protein